MHFYSRQIIDAQTSDGHVINLAGRQRMLSQRMAKELLMMVQHRAAGEAAPWRQQLQDSASTWNKVHIALQRGDPRLQLPGRNSEAVSGLFQSLEPHYLTIKQGVVQILGQSPPRAVTICRELVGLHGGEIGVRNNEGRGATFWFQLPAKPPTGRCCRALGSKDRTPASC